MADSVVILVGLVIRGKYPLVIMELIKEFVFCWVPYLRRSMLKSPMIYGSLFSAEIFDVISDSLSTNKSVSASGGLLGR